MFGITVDRGGVRARVGFAGPLWSVRFGLYPRGGNSLSGGRVDGDGESGVGRICLVVIFFTGAFAGVSGSSRRRFRIMGIFRALVGAERVFWVYIR